jgi:hypothetical protein
MSDDPTRPDQPDGQQRFRADLLAYLDSLPVHELGELLGELPSTRQEPLQVGVLIVALNERLPDAYKLLPPAGLPGPHEGRRRSLREVVADRRAARAVHRAGPPPPGLAEWHANRQQQAEQHTDRAGAVAERRVAEALREWPTDSNPAGDHPHPDEPPAGPPDRARGRPGEERDSDRENRCP